MNENDIYLGLFAIFLTYPKNVNNSNLDALKKHLSKKNNI